ncbi:helicase-related protein [Methyloprofundus sp.]|uniref:helicase-related protein n=1 Tax=Methyloprofundus sp. TaxID=2020875 RepID=UPI003D0A8A25
MSEAQVQILLCSEIGSEGRNFQFVHHLILLELPENPDLLQQRIGRLDRIGQQHTIKIHVPYIVGSKQHSLYRWYAEGLKLFQQNSNAASEVYRLQRLTLEEVCLSDSQQGLDQLVESARLHLQQIETQMHQSRDVLLELNSFREKVAEELAEEIDNISYSKALWRYMEEIFECFGIESEYHSEDCAILQAGQLQRVSDFPGVPEDGVTVTTNRNIALAREDMQYLSWEHPMLVSAMDLVLSGKVGHATVSIIKHEELPAGQYLLECLYLVECSAPLHLQLSRFLPATPIRILVDQQLQDLTAQFTHAELREIDEKIEMDQVSAFISSEQKNINAMIATAEQKAEINMQGIIGQAKTEMLKSLAKEIKRLDALSRVNSLIKPEEISDLKTSAIASHEYIAGAKLRLDAVRFIISS